MLDGQYAYLQFGSMSILRFLFVLSVLQGGITKTEAFDPFIPPSHRDRPIDINRLLLDMQVVRPGNWIDIDLFDGRSLQAVVVAADRNIDDVFTVRARVQDSPDGLVVFTVSGELFEGRISLPVEDALFRIRLDPETLTYRLIEVDQDAMPRDECGVGEFESQPDRHRTPDVMSLSSDEEMHIPQADSDEIVTINVMLVYTPAALQELNHNQLIQAGIAPETVMASRIAGGLALAQESLDRSEAYIHLNHVHTAEIDYEEYGEESELRVELRRITMPPGGPEDLDSLNLNGDLELANGDIVPAADLIGYMDEVHDWRKQYMADLVVLVTSDDASTVSTWRRTTFAGLAWLPTTLSGQPDRGFSVVKVSHLDGYTLIHELGHNMGLNHDASNTDNENAVADYAYGWRTVINLPFGNAQPRSVMAYRPGSRVPLFSGPESLVNDQPLGVADKADNTRVLREIRHAIAAYCSEEEAWDYVETEEDINTPFRPIWHVIEGGTGDGEGTAWTNALPSLQAALERADAGEQIWVAAGTYYPDEPVNENDPRSARFQLRDEVDVLGGFAGTEDYPYERDISANPTILSADINQSDTIAGNANVVVEGASGLLLEGFKITGAVAVGGDSGIGLLNQNVENMKIRWMHFTENIGTPIANENSVVTITHSELRDNTSFTGALIDNEDSVLRLENVLIADNSIQSSGSSSVGAAIRLTESDMTLVNATLANQGTGSASDVAGALALNSSSGEAVVQIHNSILWDPDGDWLVIAADDQTELVMTHSNVHDPDYRGRNGNIMEDPQFVNPAHGDFRLALGSPCIDTGDSEILTDALPLMFLIFNPLDVSGLPRIMDGNADGVPAVDMGAYEFCLGMLLIENFLFERIPSLIRHGLESDADFPRWSFDEGQNWTPLHQPLLTPTGHHQVIIDNLPSLLEPIVLDVTLAPGQIKTIDASDFPSNLVDLQDVALSDHQVAAGQPFEVLAVLYNENESMGGTFPITIRVDGAEYSRAIAEVPANQTKTFTTAVAIATAGTYSIEVNQARPMTIEVLPTDHPAEIIVGGVEFYPGEEMGLGETLHVQLVIGNIGDQPGELHSAFIVENQVIEPIDVQLDGGQSQSLSLTWSSVGGERGAYTVRLDKDLIGTVFLLDKLDQWAREFGLEGADAEPDADPAGDGHSNAAKYAFGGDPREAMDELVETRTSNAGDIVVRWKRRTDASVEYAVQASSDLNQNAWESLTAGEDFKKEVLLDPAPEGYERVEAVLTPSGELTFFRVEAIIDPL